MKHLYDNGVWAIFSTLDPRVLQFKPGILMTPELSEELLGEDRGGHRQGVARGSQEREGRHVSELAVDLLTEPAGVPRARADVATGPVGGLGLLAL